MPLSKKREESDPLIGQIRARGLPLTKSSYVQVMFEPGDPEFPLHADVEARVPPDLPGPMPQELIDLLQDPPSSKRAFPGGRGEV